MKMQDLKKITVSTIPELHDLMVVAIARKYEVPLITNDSEIIRSGEVKTVWEKRI